jgi:hypothetical protein
MRIQPPFGSAASFAQHMFAHAARPSLRRSARRQTGH